MNKEPNLYDKAKEVWRELGLLDFIEPLAVRERSGAVILEHLLCGELPGGRVLPIVHGIETVMVAVWFLWWDRRRKTHDEVVGTTSRSALSIRGIVANSLSLKAKAPSRRIKWTRPATGIIKLNVDASFHADLGSGAIGALLRDSNGAFIAASCSFKEYAIDAPSMEAVVVFEGLRLADELGISTVAVECDSQDIVQAILDPSNYRASGAVVTDDCRQIGMKTERKRTELGATTFVFIFFCRSGNEYRNPGNEYGNRYYRKRTRSEYRTDTKTEVGADRNLKTP